MCLRFLCSLALFLLPTISPAQQRVDPHFTHFRAICIFPVNPHSKHAANAFLPDYLPAPDDPDQKGILAYSQEISDNGKWAIAEIVVVDRKSLQEVLEDVRPGVWVVEKGRLSKDEIHGKLKQFKKNFDIENFGAVVR
jgi:hypothetical protein